MTSETEPAADRVVLRDQPVVDFSHLTSPDQRAGISRIEDVALVVVPQSLAGAYAAISVSDVAGTIYVPDGANVRVDGGRRGRPRRCRRRACRHGDARHHEPGHRTGAAWAAAVRLPGAEADAIYRRIIATPAPVPGSATEPGPVAVPRLALSWWRDFSAGFAARMIDSTRPARRAA